MMIKKIILYIALTCFSLIAYAGEHGDMQVDCHSKQIQYAQQKIWLNENSADSTAHLYILHNLSDTSFWINHDNNKESAGAGWSSHMSPNHWSAIQISQKKFNLTCTAITSAGTAALDCAHLLRVCLVTNAKDTSKDQSSGYWVAEDQAKKTFYHSIVARGFNFSTTTP